jgi:hypothetical protein
MGRSFLTNFILIMESLYGLLERDFDKMNTQER